MQELILVQLDEKAPYYPAGYYPFDLLDLAWLERFGDQYLFTCTDHLTNTVKVNILSDTPALTAMTLQNFLRDKQLQSKAKILRGQTLSNDAITSNWRPLSANLTRIIYALRCVCEEGDSGNFVTFAYRGEGNYFVQFAGGREEIELIGDASSNNFLEEGHLLNTQQIRLMEQRGWETPEPGGFGFYRKFRAGNNASRYEIALEVQYIFESVYRLNFQRALRVNLELQ